MEPPSNNKIPPDRARENSLVIDSSASPPPQSTMSAAAVANANNQLVLYSAERPSASASIVSLASNVSSASSSPSTSSSSVTAPIEKLSRPMAFDKMESLVKEMQDTESGVPVRSQKIFLTSIPSAFMGYDLIEWLMERLNVEESEALNMANQLCQHGYFFPVSDSKTLVVKDDSSLYRFQTPYYWPWRQQKAPDQIEYAIYLAKRSLRNKQRHGLEDYETEALASCHKNLKGKWDFILMQAEEQIKLGKDRKKGDKIVSDSQEKAYWRVHRPPPSQFTPLEFCPIPSRGLQGKPRKRNEDDWKREIEIMKTSMGRNRMKMSTACESLVAYFETFADYDPLMQPALPSNPWVTEDITFWQLNSPIVDIPTEKRVRRWAISIEELCKDPTGLNEFTSYLRKEYSHENIRFWLAVNDLRRSSHSQIARKVREIYEEFLEPGAPCEINIDGKTMEKVQQGLKTPSRFTFDVAAEHVYTLLLKKDCYPRFVRSEHYKNLVANAIQPSTKKRFFGFGGQAKKKISTTQAPSISHFPQAGGGNNNSSLPRRRGSDRSLSGSAHELAVCGVNKDSTKVVHSHSQSNLSEIPYREPTKQLESTAEACSVCPWETMDPPTSSSSTSATLQPPASPAASTASKLKISVDLPSKFTSSSSDIVNTDVSERMKRSCGLGLRQNTLDSDFHSTKRLAPVINEQRRASMTMAPRISDLAPTTTTLIVTTRAPEDEFDIPIEISEPTLVIDKADSIEEEKEEDADECSGTTKEADDVLEASAHERRRSSSSHCDTMKCDKETLSAAAATQSVDTKARKSSLVAKKSFESDSEATTASPPTSICIQTTTSTMSALRPDEKAVDLTCKRKSIDKQKSDDDVANAQSKKHVETQQDETEAQEIEMMTYEEARNKDCQARRKASSDETCCEAAVIAKRKSIDEKSKQIFLSQHTISQEDDYDIALASGLLPGCVAPAPTPAPSMAPLAEVEVDPNEEDPLEAQQESSMENVQSQQPQKSEKMPSFDGGEKKKKRKERKEKQGSCEQDEAGASTTTPVDPEKAKHNAVCPWEDEDMTTAVEAPFVKTYATLGYL